MKILAQSIALLKIIIIIVIVIEMVKAIDYYNCTN